MHASVSDILADVAANSIEARAARIFVLLAERDGMLTLSVEDNGKGMDAEVLARAFDPFYTEPGKHDGRRVGLGLPFVRQTCEACGGTATLTSEKGVGTKLSCTFRLDSFDLPPLGDVVATVLSLMSYPGDFELIFSRVRGESTYEIARSELGEAIGGFESVQSLALAREFLQGQEDDL